MSHIDWAALAPLVCLTIGALVQMLAIAFARHLLTTLVVSIITLIATTASLFSLQSALPVYATPLLMMDGHSVFFSILIMFAAIAVTLLAWDYLKDREALQDEFFLLLMLATMGALVVVNAAHFAAFFLGLEMMGVSIYALMSYPGKGLLSLEAALKYLILSGVSSSFLLFGVALMFASTGVLDLALMARAAEPDDIYLLAGVTLLVAGVVFKLSLVPFHMWTPDVYQGAPAPVTAFVATVSKGAVFALVLRLFLTADLIGNDVFGLGFSLVAVLSMLFGNLLALRQDDVKRMLAYSSIAQIGYLMVAFIAAGAIGGHALAVEAVSFFLFAYFVTTLGAFGVITMLSIGRESDASDLVDYQGLFYRQPGIAAVFSACMLSLAGIPLTAGFIGKFYIFATGVNGSLWLLLAAVIVGSGIGLFYYLRVIYTMTVRNDEIPATRIPVMGGGVILMLSVTLITFGMYPTPIINMIATLAVATN